MTRAQAAILALVVLAGACRSTQPAALAAGVVLEEGVRLEVVFEGQRSFDSERLAEVVAPDLADLERRRSVRAAIDDAAYSLEIFYRDQGFPACRVDYETEPVRDGVLPARMLVEEGPRVSIGAVRFEGLSALTAADLETFILPRRRWRILPRRRVWFVASRLQASVEAIEAYYQVNGLLDARVELVSPDLREGPWKDRVTVRLRVEEGLRYKLRRLEVVGGVPSVDARFDSAALAQETVHPRLAGTLRGRLSELYARAGYPDVRIEVRQETDREEGLVDIVLVVQPGPLVTLGEVVLDGHVRTAPSRILGALTLESGDRYDVAEQRTSFRHLYSLGVFSSVGLTLERPDEGATPAAGDQAAGDQAAGDQAAGDQAAGDQAAPADGQPQARAPGQERRDLHVRLEEAPSRELYFEPGYGSYEGLRAVLGWRERNLFGDARTLSVEGLVSQKAQRATVDLTDPRLLDSESVAILSLFGGRREEPSFISSDVGATATIGRELREHLRLALAYQYRYSGVEADDLSDPGIQELLSDVNISSISATPSWDTRDSVFFPVEGNLARLSLEWGDSVIGSELDFLRGRWNLAHFLSLDGTSVVGVSWRGGVIAPLHGSATIPIQERFFNGGENTVRSFREDQLGPVDSGGKPIGGEAYNVFTLELRERLVGRLELGLFWDVGNVVEDYNDFFAFPDLRHGLGAGLRYALPVGPVRLDAGWNPDPRQDEGSYAIHLSVGLSF